MPLTIEQQRALAVAQAKRKRAEAEAGPSLRSETDAIIEEAAAAIPGGFAAFDAKPADPQRMAAMGYVQDPLAKSGYARPQAQQPRMADTGNQNSLIADVARGLEAPVRGLTGGGLEGWARTTQADPLLGATQAVDFISPVDDLGRAYQGAKQAGAGLIDGDMAKAGEGAQQLAIDGSFAALQMLPGSMAARGLNVPKNTLALNVADLERAAVQATRAPPVGKPAPQAAAPQPQPAPFSAPAEPKASGFLRNNADRIVGGGVGAFAGSAGDALAAPGDGNEGGPDIINPVTGAFAGMIAPRMAARGYRSARSAIQGGGFNEAVAVRAVRNALAPAGRSADEIAALNLSQYGDKPSVLADLTQNAQNFSVGLSRQPGRAAELASEQSGDLARTRTGRLFTDVETTTNINPATVTADIDAAIKQASEEISPAYEALFANNAGVNSERLMQLADDPVVGPYVRRAIQASESLQTTAGQAPSNARTWDLVKRGLDRTIESQKRSGGQAAYELEKARGAIKDELDALMPEYKAVRDGADAPRMRDARKQGSKVAGGGLSVEQVRAIASKFTGKPLTALQMGAVEKIVLDIEKARGLDGLSSERMREVFGAVFSQDTADKLVARIRADQTILKNAQRRDPDFGSATSQAGMADRGMGAMAADAFRAVRNPLEAALAALSRSGAYTQDQRNRIAEMLYSGATDDNLARIYNNRPPRNPLNVEPPPTPYGPPVNRLGMSGSPEALGAAGGTAIGMATAPDQNGDGVVDAQERMMGGAGGALTGGIAGRGVRGGMNALAPKVKAAPVDDALELRNRVYAPGKPDPLGFITSAERALANPPARFRDAQKLTADQWRKFMREGGASKEAFTNQIEPALKSLGETGDITREQFEEALARNRTTLRTAEQSKATFSEAQFDPTAAGAPETQFSDYIAPGPASRYRQEVVVMPGLDYKSHNWNTRGAIGHIRTTERRVGRDRVLHVEELQSDLHQEGAKYGYHDDPSVRYVADPRGDFYKKRDAYDEWVRNFVEGPHEKRPYFVPIISGDAVAPPTNPIGAELLREAQAAYARSSGKASVPRAPMESWEEPFVRRAMQSAARDGYSIVTFPTHATLNDALKTEGTKKFYDQRLPNTLARVAKSLGLEVETISLPIAQSGLRVEPAGGMFAVMRGDDFVSVHKSRAEADALASGAVNKVPAIRLTPAAKAELSKGVVMDASGNATRPKGPAVGQSPRNTLN